MRDPRPRREDIERLQALLRGRVRNVRGHVWPTLQTSVAAGAAWEISHSLLHHQRPIFAPITAVVAMGFSAGRRGVQAAVIVVGTALGVGVSDLVLRHLGSGVVQLTITVFVAMLLALLLSRRPLFVSQVGISALLLVTLGPVSGVSRLVDALAGGGVALVLSLLLFPIDPVASVRRSADPVLGALARSLGHSAVALRSADQARADAARAGIVDERRVGEAVEVALEATRLAPRRRRDRARVQTLATAARSLPPLSRGVRVIAGATQRLVRDGDVPQERLGGAVERLAGAVGFLHDWLGSEDEQARARAREEAVAAAREAVDADSRGLGGATVAHLVQALAAHVLAATGLDPVAAQEAVGTR